VPPEAVSVVVKVPAMEAFGIVGVSTFREDGADGAGAGSVDVPPHAASETRQAAIKVICRSRRSLRSNFPSMNNVFFSRKAGVAMAGRAASTCAQTGGSGLSHRAKD
jgi:hypothetical protein